MLETKDVAEILGTTKAKIRRAADEIRELFPYRQFGAPGRFTMYYTSGEIDAIKLQLTKLGKVTA